MGSKWGMESSVRALLWEDRTVEKSAETDGSLIEDSVDRTVGMSWVYQ